MVEADVSSSSSEAAVVVLGAAVVVTLVGALVEALVGACVVVVVVAGGVPEQQPQPSIFVATVLQFSVPTPPGPGCVPGRPAKSEYLIVYQLMLSKHKPFLERYFITS